ncbi:hypothetical protein HNE05_04195 [Aquipseudomonas campi]|uniref:Outer membrane protein n=1 Tax=Aquipseudomonas campi TaxID=2731681 RepID=A0A6M8FEG7_9GAMM|nr:hypothetical protein [Pseudomonas campi]QKE62592.1 hypothetical protein HNE05_04195 [Pseudomonas campi]
MHLRIMTPALLALSLTGCNDIFNSGPSWALANKSKIQSAVSENIKQLNPYPAELDSAYQEAKEEYERTNSQISELKRNGMQRCMNLQVEQPEKQPPQPMQRMQPPPMPSYAYGSLSANSRANPQVQACIQNLEKDQLILDLKAKAQSFNQLQQQRREHDLKVHKIVDASIDTAIASYAREHGFRLIISNEQSILYNQNQQVLDVTSGVIELLQQPAPTQ